MKKKNPSHTPDSPHNSNTFYNTGSAHGNSRARSRRKFLGDVGGITAATLVAGVAGTPVLGSVAVAAVADDAVADGLNNGGLRGTASADKALSTRMQSVHVQRVFPLPDQRNNGDEDLYANRIGNFSKALPHNQLGEVNRDAYESLLKAVNTGDPANFDAIIMGGPLKLTSPQGGLAFDMQGADPGHVFQPPAPTFASAEIAGEIAENYWMALTRDVFFLDYEEHPLTIAAAEDLSKFSDFRGPRFPRTNSRLNPRGLRRPGDALSVEAEAQDECHGGAEGPSEGE